MLKTYLDCWMEVAGGLFPQALAGEPKLLESFPRPLGKDAFAFTVVLVGDEQGQFTVALGGAILETPLLGEGVDQKTAWGELLREVAEASAGELLAASGKSCRVESIAEVAVPGKGTRAFDLKSSERSWPVLVLDAVRPVAIEAQAPPAEKQVPPARKKPAAVEKPSQDSAAAATGQPVWPGLDLLLDVELDASLRFGSREMPLGAILDLGPGDVVQLDRHVSDPVDLIVADKIVARGEVVLVNGSFGLRVTEVAAPRKRLESIRCLF